MATKKTDSFPVPAEALFTEIVAAIGDLGWVVLEQGYPMVVAANQRWSLWSFGETVIARVEPTTGGHSSVRVQVRLRHGLFGFGTTDRRARQLLAAVSDRVERIDRVD